LPHQDAGGIFAIRSGSATDSSVNSVAPACTGQQAGCAINGIRTCAVQDWLSVLNSAPRVTWGGRAVCRSRGDWILLGSSSLFATGRTKYSVTADGRKLRSTRTGHKPRFGAKVPRHTVIPPVQPVTLALNVLTHPERPARASPGEVGTGVGARSRIRKGCGLWAIRIIRPAARVLGH
jgi:hypothetical protein